MTAVRRPMRPIALIFAFFVPGFQSSASRRPSLRFLYIIIKKRSYWTIIGGPVKLVIFNRWSNMTFFGLLGGMGDKK
jgi:hypothetical protein